MKVLKSAWNHDAMRPLVSKLHICRGANAAARPSQPETRDIDKVLDKIQFVIDASLEIGRIGVGRARQASKHRSAPNIGHRQTVLFREFLLWGIWDTFSIKLHV